jgi:hypothetical protein
VPRYLVGPIAASVPSVIGDGGKAMHVTLFGFVLFLHITVAIAAFMMAGIAHAGLPAMAKASDVREMRPWAAVLHRLDPLFPLAALLLLGLGAWLVHLSGGEFAWKDGWVTTAVIALVVIEGFAGALLAPKAKALTKAVKDAADGPVPESLHQAAMEPRIWHISHIATFGFAGVVFLMSAKPSGVWSLIIVVAGVAIGFALSTAQLRTIAAARAGTPVGDAGVPSTRRPVDESVAEA